MYNEKAESARKKVDEMSGVLDKQRNHIFEAILRLR